MRRADFAYELPAELIAQVPLPERGGSRLLYLHTDSGAIEDRRFADFIEMLRPNDLLVLNDTQVIPARVIGAKPTGGRVEILLERILEGHRILAHVHASKALRPKAPVALPGGTSATFIQRHGDLFELELSAEPLAYFQRFGAMPLPPYIERDASDAASSRYQTVFAREPGAVAAPTAGLHFDAATLRRCRERGVRIEHVTLHVGAGTFQPVRVDDLAQHHMHAERVVVTEAVCDAVRETRERGGRVIAVGTTVVRSLEAAGQLAAQHGGELQPFAGETQLFITPGYRFQIVDALLTNFHLPESTLLMLVCAFGGYDNVMNAYRHAVSERYRFFSYGDAMFLERR